MEVEIDFPKDAQSSEFERRSVSLNQAIHEYFDQAVRTAPMKNVQEAYQLLRKVTGIKTFTKYQKTVAANGFRTREAIRKYVL